MYELVYCVSIVLYHTMSYLFLKQPAVTRTVSQVVYSTSGLNLQVPSIQQNSSRQVSTELSQFSLVVCFYFSSFKAGIASAISSFK